MAAARSSSGGRRGSPLGGSGDQGRRRRGEAAARPPPRAPRRPEGWGRRTGWGLPEASSEEVVTASEDLAEGRGNGGSSVFSSIPLDMSPPFLPERLAVLGSMSAAWSEGSTGAARLVGSRSAAVVESSACCASARAPPCSSWRHEGPPSPPFSPPRRAHRRGVGARGGEA
jgi:hypothetical protein